MVAKNISRITVLTMFLLCPCIWGEEEIVNIYITPLNVESDTEYKTLADDLMRLGHFRKYAHQAFHPQALVTKADRDPLDIILRRTRAVLEDISGMPDGPDLSALNKELTALEEESHITSDRRDLFRQVHALRRKIAFSNPLLDFDQILFIKRHRSTFNHMCDQFYGINAVAGGGMFVLADPFTEQPHMIDLLKDVKVATGRLKGQKLNKGSFLSPELSYDAKTVFFAYVECTGDKGHIGHLDHASRGHWTRGRCYHLFSVDLDDNGRAFNLRQLTDGTFNDFDPCLLPNGRVAFISERRGGYLRCGRACPSYTLHDMKPDGTDIRLLSPHENNEWQPSITHDGMILYTRWDYVDRHGCTAHHPWIMTPDGRDSRSMHGNFSIKAKRADMEMDLLSIPDSHKIIGTAAPHHGQSFGSIIIFDPRIPDNDAMAPVKRVTPEIGFPESQGGRQVYGTAWPLSEKYYLCVYDAGMRIKSGKQGQGYQRGEYGLYLLDAFGNKELIYRDPEIACLSPIPLKHRKRPHVLPERSERLKEDPPMDGTMAVINVYESIREWPKDTQIKALRIYQIYPCSVPSGSPPHEMGTRIAEARDSVNLARGIIGTVPVESDGSAYFKVPAMKELFFQALDENGLAVQSMRSATWIQPGEEMTCYGCHEPKSRAPVTPQKTPIALTRSPSTPKPDVDGTHPFSYPRLVQPVLDSKCVDCHVQNLDKNAPPLDKTIVQTKLPGGGVTTPVYRSYQSLINYGFHKYGDAYRTTPGKFGAKASRLYDLLIKGHHDVELTTEELHRITVWLDSVSNFYGVYEKEGGQTQLRGEIAHPTLE